MECTMYHKSAPRKTSNEQEALLFTFFYKNKIKISKQG